MFSCVFWSSERAAKELPRVYRTYDQVFNLRFLENMGVILYNKGTIHSAAVDTSFDTRFELNFYEDQKEVGVRTSFSLI